jgi:RNA polymerase sigma-70 factor, ECF subfamily
MSEKQRDFDRLFRQYHRLIVAYFVHRGAGRDEAADLAQDAFANVYSGLHGIRDETSERSWLFSIARNVWRNHLRDQSRLKRDAPETPLDDLLAGGWEPTNTREVSDPLTGTLENEKQKKVWDAISSLPPQMRRCVMLRVGQDRKYREIADAMQISIQTVRSQLSQGRDHLRRLLAEYFEDLQ